MTDLEQLKKIDQKLKVMFSEISLELLEICKNPKSSTLVKTRDDGDTTKSFDLDCELQILKILNSSQLKIKVLGEETGISYINTNLDSEISYVVYVDPVDGSDMLDMGYALTSTAITFVDFETGTPVCSRIVEVSTGHQWSVFQDEMGDFAKNRTCSEVKEITEAFLVAYLSPARRRKTEIGKKILDLDTRHLLSYEGPLDIAKIATGQCDIVVEPKCSPRDFTPGAHIAKVAGATILNFDGSEFTWSTNYDPDFKLGFIAAGTPELAQKVAKELNK